MSKLADHYLITPAPEDEGVFLATLERSLQQGITLMQLRAKNLDSTAYSALASNVVALAHRYACRVLLNASADVVEAVGADGVHLDSGRLAQCQERPLDKTQLVAASCHTLDELKKAERIQADFALLSPVKYTKSHPDAAPLGWQRFSEMAAQVSVPVFALGGVSAKDREVALQSGAQGLAGIRGYWVV